MMQVDLKSILLGIVIGFLAGYILSSGAVKQSVVEKLAVKEPAVEESAAGVP